MSVLIASYDGVMFFNRDVKPSNGMSHMYKSLHLDWLNIANGRLRRGDLARAKEAFEVSAAYARLALQKVRGL